MQARRQKRVRGGSSPMRSFRRSGVTKGPSFGYTALGFAHGPLLGLGALGFVCGRGKSAKLMIKKWKAGQPRPPGGDFSQICVRTPPPQEGGLLGLWHWPWHSASADMSQTPDEKIHVRNAANTEFKIPNWTHTSRHPPRTPVPVPGAPDRGRSAPNQVKKRSDTHGSGIDISGQKKKVERDPGATSWYLPQGPTPTLLRSLTTRTPWSYVVMLVFAPMDLGPARGTPLTQGYSAGVWVSIAGSKEKGTGGPSRQRGLFYCAR